MPLLVRPTTYLSLQLFVSRKPGLSRQKTNLLSCQNLKFIHKQLQMMVP
jgi:hypothetical protein